MPGLATKYQALKNGCSHPKCATHILIDIYSIPTFDNYLYSDVLIGHF